MLPSIQYRLGFRTTYSMLQKSLPTPSPPQLSKSAKWHDAAASFLMFQQGQYTTTLPAYTITIRSRPSFFPRMSVGLGCRNKNVAFTFALRLCPGLLPPCYFLQGSLLIQVKAQKLSSHPHQPCTLVGAFSLESFSVLSPRRSKCSKVCWRAAWLSKQKFQHPDIVFGLTFLVVGFLLADEKSWLLPNGCNCHDLPSQTQNRTRSISYSILELAT